MVCNVMFGYTYTLWDARLNEQMDSNTMLNPIGMLYAVKFNEIFEQRIIIFFKKIEVREMTLGRWFSPKCVLSFFGKGWN